MFSMWSTDTDFADMTKMAKRNWVVRDFRDFMQSVIYRIQRGVAKHGMILNENETLQKFNIKALAAAFLSVNRPLSCFEQLGDKENALLNSAKVVVPRMIELIRTASIAPNTVNWMEHRAFLAEVDEYIRVFWDWKDSNAAVIKVRMQHALRAIYEAELRTKRARMEDSESQLNIMLSAFKKQKVMLRKKMVAIFSPAEISEIDNDLIQRGYEVTDQDVEMTDGDADVSSLFGKKSNLQLLHELLFDPEFRFKCPSDATIYSNSAIRDVKKLFSDAFWNSIVDDLKHTPVQYSRVVNCIDEIKDGIKDVCPDPTVEVSSHLSNIDSFKHRIVTEALSLVECIPVLDSLYVVIAGMHTDSRKADMEAKWKNMDSLLLGSQEQDLPTNFIAYMKFLLEEINLVRLDAANKRLDFICPSIQVNGFEYERAKLNNAIKANPDYLQRTNGWIYNAISLDMKQDRVMIQKLIDGDEESVRALYADAFVSLVVNDPPIHPDNCPELLLLDFRRLKNCEREFQFQVIAFAMYAGLCIRVANRPLIAHLKESLNSFDVAKVEDGNLLEAFKISFGLELTEDEKTAMLPDLQPGQDYTHLLQLSDDAMANSRTCMKHYWMRVLSRDNVYSLNDIEVHHRIFGVLKNRVKTVFDVMRRVIDLNFKIHSDRIKQMIAEQAAKYMASL